MKKEHFDHVYTSFNREIFVEMWDFSTEYLDVDVSDLYIEEIKLASSGCEYWVCSDNSATLDQDYVIFKVKTQEDASKVMQCLVDAGILFL